MGMSTPWGLSDHEKRIAPGILQVMTPSHGGYHLDEECNKRVHAAWRDRRGWYEEDDQWCAVALTFPQHFTPAQLADAERLAKNYYPDAYERVFGVKLTEADSHERRQQAFRTETYDRYVVSAAFGSWYTSRAPIPDGMVGVVAKKASNGVERWFLVPHDEYERRTNVGFVIDEDRHRPWLTKDEHAREQVFADLKQRREEQEELQRQRFRSMTPAAQVADWFARGGPELAADQLAHALREAGLLV